MLLEMKKSWMELKVKLEQSNLRHGNRIKGEETI